MPSVDLSPVGSLINLALANVPKLPVRFDRRFPEVRGINDDKVSERNKNRSVLSNTQAKSEKRKDSYFSKFMLERLKKSSILNHEVFKHEGVDYKLQVAKRYTQYQEIMKRRGSSLQPVRVK